MGSFGVDGDWIKQGVHKGLQALSKTKIGKVVPDFKQTVTLIPQILQTYSSSWTPEGLSHKPTSAESPLPDVEKSSQAEVLSTN